MAPNGATMRHGSPSRACYRASGGGSGMPGGTNASELDGVSMAFELADGAVDVLRSITLSIRQGDFVSLLGPSGCGKSTLLRLIADILTPTQGRISVLGTSPAE